MARTHLLRYSKLNGSLAFGFNAFVVDGHYSTITIPATAERKQCEFTSFHLFIICRGFRFWCVDMGQRSMQSIWVFHQLERLVNAIVSVIFVVVIAVVGIDLFVFRFSVSHRSLFDSINFESDNFDNITASTANRIV